MNFPGSALLLVLGSFVLGFYFFSCGTPLFFIKPGAVSSSYYPFYNASVALSLVNARAIPGKSSPCGHAMRSHGAPLPDLHFRLQALPIGVYLPFTLSSAADLLSRIYVHCCANLKSSFRNGEFEMMTNSPNNSFVENGVLYIVPTLTSDVIGSNAIFDGFTFNITGCTADNATSCGAVSNQTTKTVINPIQSARLTTVNSSSIQYGKVEVRAKIPTGDWIWPAIWMLPVDDTYGPWPLSGEIDIMEARGNARTYTAQGVDFVRASLNWGPLTWLNAVFRTFGFWEERRSTFNEDFHTYTLEWSDKFMYVPSYEYPFTSSSDGLCS